MRATHHDLYRVILDYACGGIVVVTNGRVTDAPPIYQWMIGKTFTSVKASVIKRGGQITKGDAK